MLNTVKHLYRVAECIRGIVAYSALTVCLFLATVRQAQTYTIETLDGTSTAIKIQDRKFHPFTAARSTDFAISCPTDKLILPEYWALGEARVVNRKFLLIRYYVRGGSGTGIGNTLLVCIKGGKLRRVLHINSYFYDLGYEKITTSHTKLLLDRNNTIHATVYDTLELKQNSRHDSITSRRSNISKSTIRFNKNQRAFCNYQKQVNATIGSFNHRANKFIKRHFTGTASAFQFNNCEYILIDNRWYSKNKGSKEYSSLD